MKCPVCDSALTVSTCRGVEVQLCSDCCGGWLSRRALESAVGVLAVPGPAAAAAGSVLVSASARESVSIRRPAPVLNDFPYLA